MTAALPTPVHDRQHFIDVIRRLVAEAGPVDNDWSHLLTSEPVSNHAEHLLDVFTLCRTTPDLFGAITVDGYLGAFSRVGGYDDAWHNASVTVALVLPGSRVSLAGRTWVLHEFFGGLTGSAQEVTLAVLARLGVEAELLVLEHNELVGG